MRFRTLHSTLSALTLLLFAAAPQPAASAPVHLVDEAPGAITRVAPGVHLVDFGRVAFGNLRLLPPAGARASVTVNFGEAFANGRINRKPPGSVRYATATVTLAGPAPVVAAPPPDARNTRQLTGAEKPDQHGHITPPAILTPKEWGVILPFRWVEIEGWPGELRPEHLRRQSAFAATWDDTAAAFRSSDDALNRIWELCRYSIKATTFAGVYVDGERERIPYEADAYLNQLSHYATDRDVQMARDTFDWLMRYPTWPTEWAAHLIFMVHADWMHTGDRAWAAARYEALKPKLLLERARADGLLTSNAAQVKKGDLVDWPAAERDRFVFTPVNTVVNAFHLRSLALMAELADALGHAADARSYRDRAAATHAAFQAGLFDATRGVYRDGEGTDHASQHANFFPLAFGLVPRLKSPVSPPSSPRAAWPARCTPRSTCSKPCSSTAPPTTAHALIVAPTDRSWRHMVESGTTITWEAWDQKYKPNQDWNHAWGAAPANLFPRYVLGVQATAPGWSRARLRPHPGPLTHASGRIPTPRGPVSVDWRRDAGFRLEVTFPPGVAARLELPAPAGSREVLVDGRPSPARREGDRWVLATDVTGRARIEVR
jgi:alpha-L-rhamnosidase